MTPTPQQQLKRIAEVPIMGKYDEVLLPFKRLMETELHANAAKGDRPGWLGMTAEQCLLEIYYHVSKLQKAVRDGNGDRIKENTADVANMAMMLADICGALEMDQPSDGALTNEGAEPVAYIDPAHLQTMGKTATGSASCVIFNSSQGGCLEPLYRRASILKDCNTRAAASASCTCPSGDGSLRWPCPVHPPEVKAFQARVQPWMTACFGEVIASDRQERNHRFLEEALELVQACGATIGEAHQLVDYVYGRAVGEPAQEVGGVMVTLAALCLAQGMDMHQAAEVELARIWTKVEQIRAKQLAKPAIGPLPGVYPDRKP